MPGGGGGGCGEDARLALKGPGFSVWGFRVCTLAFGVQGRRGLGLGVYGFGLCTLAFIACLEGEIW